MLKRTDAQIFVMSHKKYDIKENSLITPLQVAAAQTGENIYDLKDNTGKNIAEWNPICGELTGMFWISLNINDYRLKYVGQTAYRRQFDIDENFDFDKVFKEYDIILAKAQEWDEVTVRTQYELYHNVDDLNFAVSIIKDRYPEYAKTCDDVLNGQILYNGNNFIMRKNEYDKYINFLFDILNTWLEYHKFESPEDVIAHVHKMGDEHKFQFFQNGDEAVGYQRRVLGFLSERIFTIYCIHNFKNPYFITRILSEGTDY